MERVRCHKKSMDTKLKTSNDMLLGGSIGLHEGPNTKFDRNGRRLPFGTLLKGNAELVEHGVGLCYFMILFNRTLHALPSLLVDFNLPSCQVMKPDVLLCKSAFPHSPRILNSICGVDPTLSFNRHRHRCAEQ